MADALRVLIGFVVVVVLIGVLLVTCSVGGIAVWTYSTNKSSEERLAKVGATLRWKAGDCTKDDFPLTLKVTNNSGRAIISLELEPRAYRPNYSRNVARYANYATDRIIRSDETFVTCFRHPGLTGEYDASTLIWSGKITYSFD